MLRIRIFLMAGISFFFSLSCIDRDILNVSDSLEIHSSYSVPIGDFSYDINNYLESVAAFPYSSPDSLYFENVLYPNPDSAVYFSSTDTFAFNLISDPSRKVRSIEFVILISNGYPTEASAQVYFLSGTSIITSDPVFSGGPIRIEPAVVNDEGLVTDPSITRVSVTMPPEFIQKLSVINGIQIKGMVNTTRSDIPRVKFLRKYQIDIFIGSRIELLFNTGEL